MLLRRLALPPLLFVTGAVAAPTTLSAAPYHVGPGQSYATPSDVPWESLVAGDSVLIHPRSSPYRDKWVICRVGTPSAPIVVRGIPDAGGALPVIDGASAVTRPALNFWNEERGVVKIGGANRPPDTMPAWISIENLEIRGARPESTFTGRSGLTHYASNAAAIYIEKGQHVTVRGCHLTDCSNGFFCASGTSDLLVERNWIDDSGNAGDIYTHNNYTEALGITFQFNHFGPLHAGAGGNNLKDRSAGCVIRYNWIEGGNRQLDLVESDDPVLYGDPRYHQTFVYGNVLVERGDDGNSQIAHYGGDGGTTSHYRKGWLYFHWNTMVSRRSGNTTLLRLPTAEESADVRNNILYVTAAGNRLALVDAVGTLVATRNWLKTGWVASHGGGSVVDMGQVTGTGPGFVDPAGDDFELLATSVCIDTAAAPHAATVPDHLPAFEYVRHQSGRVRPDDGARDLGAYEYPGATGVAESEAEETPRSSALIASPNPSPGSFVIRLTGGGTVRDRGAGDAVLDIFTAAGRRVARLGATRPGEWTWSPSRELPPGSYVARNASRIVRLVRIPRDVVPQHHGDHHTVHGGGRRPPESSRRAGPSRHRIAA